MLVRDAEDEVTASMLLLKALNALTTARDTLFRMACLAVLTPERAGDAPEFIPHLNQAWREAAEAVLVSTHHWRLPQALRRAVWNGIHPCLPDGLFLPIERPINPVRLFLAEEVSRAAMRRFLAGPRRRRFVPARIADAPRRVSRGRAPPALALCPL